ncbi:TOP2, partial [Symbiodinium sp. KB8]
DQPRVYDKFGDRWEYVVTTSEGQFQQVSFVNSINTIKGGTHVSHVTDQFVDSILDKVNKKNRGGMEIKPFHVRGALNM